MLNDEKGLIGCALYEPQFGMSQVYNRIRAEMFTNDFCQEIYSCLLNLYDKGETITVAEVARLLEDNRREKGEIVPFLMSCVEEVSTVMEIKAYANAVETEYKAKQIQKLFNNTKIEPKNIDSIIEDLQSTLEGLKESKDEEIKTLAQIAKENKEKRFNETVGQDLIKTGFEKFDKCIRGLEKGEMIVIGARPSAGKSAFTTQIICNIAETKKRIGYFNLEMGNEQIYDRTLARYSKIELDRIQNAKYFLNDEEGKFNKANEKLETYDNVMVISKTCSLSDVKSICRQKKFDVVIIDYLQLVKPTRYYENKAAEVGEISKQIKGLAMELKIPVVALSQMNRKVKSTDEPSMSELRESGNIEQDASIIALLWNLNEEGSLKGLKVDKNRQGTTFKETLKFEGALMTFTETDIEIGKVQEYKSVEEAEIPF